MISWEFKVFRISVPSHGSWSFPSPPNQSHDPGAADLLSKDLDHYGFQLLFSPGPGPDFSALLLQEIRSSSMQPHVRRPSWLLNRFLSED